MEKSKKTKTTCKSIEEEDNIPLLIRIIVNLFITFGLSLSIYLLIANVFLTVHKLSFHTQLLRHNEEDSFAFAPHDPDRNFVFQPNKKYYDCSQGVLSIEECDLINRYHSDYLHSVRSAMLMSSKKINTNNMGIDTSSLKVNTSFFIR
jgi:hypothetical protein